ncbi:MAG: NAD(P)/FAD-dependent oxidoreductase [Christensenellales bacterium]|jgi:glycerol-3-phosphate dehydrogenase
MIFDVAVIGAGVTGCMIARELSMYDIKICVVEAAEDVAAGASRANSGIVHAGYDAKPGSLKAALNVAGCAMMKTTAKELGVPYQQCGSLVVAFSEDDGRHIRMLFEQGVKNGVAVELVSSDQTRLLEPMLNDKVKTALYAKSAGIICPFSLTIAAAENAVENGAKLYLKSRVSAIYRDGGVYTIQAGTHVIRAKYVVNAAGVFADDISRLAGAEKFNICPRKGEYIIFDTAMEARTQSVIFGTPTDKGKGVLFAPTVYGNMIAGPTAVDLSDKLDTSTSRDGLSEALKGAMRFVPAVDKKYAITVFAGLRAVPERGDFIIEYAKRSKNFVNVAGIESPGLTCAPAIARHVAELLFSAGLPEIKKPEAKRIRKPIELFAGSSSQRQKELIQKDSRYANVVCRCRHVTEAEVVQSILRPCGATTVDGVKLRTGAGMGRCHGAFCMPRVMHILARELGRQYSDITKSGEGALILSQKTKEIGR